MNKLLKLLIAAMLLSATAGAQTTTSITGTVKDLSNAAVTSGQVTFTLRPGSDTTISGSARFVPSTVTCSITGTGAVKALDGVSTCTLVNNTSLTPSGTSYLACIQAAFISPGSCFNMYALGGSLDITTVVPTPTTSPAFNFVDLFSAQTISGAKTFTGATAFNGSLTMGALSASSATISGNATIGGTLGVTGGTTLAALSATQITNTGDMLLSSGKVIKWNADTGLSRDAAGVVDCGNGTQGDKSCNLKLATVTLGKSDGTLPATFTNDTAGGINFTSNSGKTLELNTQAQLVFFGASSGTTILMPTGVASGTLTLPAATDTLVGKATTDTLTNKTLTSPVINSTPTGTGIPTLTLKKGSGGGNYASASTTYVVVDSTNLCYTVTIPTGWKLGIQASGSIGTSTAAVAVNVALTDNAACATANAGLLTEISTVTSGAGTTAPFSLSWAITGDGNSHNVAMQFKTSNGADSTLLGNSSSTFLPTMVFTLVPSN